MKIVKPVYVEYLVLDNLIMNYILLWVTDRILKTEAKRWRIVIAAGIGTIYTILFFLPQFYFLKLLAFKVVLSFLMVLLGFGFSEIKFFMKKVGVFYGVTFIFGGATFGLYYFFSNQVFMQNGIFYIQDLPFHLLLFSGAVAVVIIRYTWVWVQKRLSQEQLHLDMEIEFDNQSRKIKALLDTGNQLCDPITRSPVVIVEFRKIKDILPKEIQSIYINSLENDLNAISTILSESAWMMKFRLIPFSSLGKENGMLLGFKPTKIRIFQAAEWKEIKNVIIGIYGERLSKENQYDALMHPEIVL